MKWGLFRTGDRWHCISPTLQALQALFPWGPPMVLRALCQCPGTFMEIVDEPPDDHDLRCQNCDKAWRALGRRQKPVTAKNPPPRGTIYRPKHRWKEP